MHFLSFIFDNNLYMFRIGIFTVVAAILYECMIHTKCCI